MRVETTSQAEKAPGQTWGANPRKTSYSHPPTLGSTTTRILLLLFDVVENSFLRPNLHGAATMPSVLHKKMLLMHADPHPRFASLIIFFSAYRPLPHSILPGLSSSVPPHCA